MHALQDVLIIHVQMPRNAFIGKWVLHVTARVTLTALMHNKRYKDDKRSSQYPYEHVGPSRHRSEKTFATTSDQAVCNCILLFKNEMHKSPVVCIELKKTAPCHEFSIVERELPVHMSHDDT